MIRIRGATAPVVAAALALTAGAGLAQSPPNRLEAVWAEARAAYGAGDYQGAIAGFEEYLELSPANASAHEALARSLGAVGRADEALVHARRAHELAPESPSSALLLGALLLNAGQREEAFALLSTIDRDAVRAGGMEAVLDELLRAAESASGAWAVRSMIDEASGSLRVSIVGPAAEIIDGQVAADPVSFSLIFDPAGCNLVVYWDGRSLADVQQRALTVRVDAQPPLELAGPGRWGCSEVVDRMGAGEELLVELAPDPGGSARRFAADLEGFAEALAQALGAVPYLAVHDVAGNERRIAGTGESWSHGSSAR